MGFTYSVNCTVSKRQAVLILFTTAKIIVVG